MAGDSIVRFEPYSNVAKAVKYFICVSYTIAIPFSHIYIINSTFPNHNLIPISKKAPVEYMNTKINVCVDGDAQPTSQQTKPNQATLTKLNSATSERQRLHPSIQQPHQFICEPFAFSDNDEEGTGRQPNRNAR